MEWAAAFAVTFYDVGGRPTAYCDDGRHMHAFSGSPLAYLDKDSVFAFDGKHLGWWERGWVLDHHGAWVFFTEIAARIDLPLPARQGRPAKGFKHPPPVPGARQVKPVRVVDGLGWSLRSGMYFFQSTY